MVDRPAPERERWLRVVRDDEPDPPTPPDHRPAPPDHRPAPPDHRPAPPDDRSTRPDDRPAAPDRRPAAPDDRSAPRPAVPTGGVPASGSRTAEPRWEPVDPSAAGSGQADEYGRAAGSGRVAGQASPGRAGVSYGSPPPTRPDTGRRRARVAWVWAGVAAGTALGAGLDRIVGGLDGKPALFLLVIFTLPFWDRLPARVPARLATLAGLVAAVAAVWLAVATARPEGWWRGEVAFGLACVIVGTVHALAPARRTVDP